MNRPLTLFIRWDGSTSVTNWKDLWAWLLLNRYWNLCLKMACLAGERRVLLARENLRGKDGALLYSLRSVAIKVRSNCRSRFFLHFPAELCRQRRSSELWGKWKMWLGMGRITVEVCVNILSHPPRVEDAEMRSILMDIVNFRGFFHFWQRFIITRDRSGWLTRLPTNN